MMGPPQFTTSQYTLPLPGALKGRELTSSSDIRASRACPVSGNTVSMCGHAYNPSDSRQLLMCHVGPTYLAMLEIRETYTR